MKTLIIYLIITIIFVLKISTKQEYMSSILFYEGCDSEAFSMLQRPISKCRGSTKRLYNNTHINEHSCQSSNCDFRCYLRTYELKKCLQFIGKTHVKYTVEENIKPPRDDWVITNYYFGGNESCNRRGVPDERRGFKSYCRERSFGSRKIFCNKEIKKVQQVYYRDKDCKNVLNITTYEPKTCYKGYNFLCPNI